MRWVAIGVLALWLVIYAFALAVYLTGTYGWFGQPIDPLSGILIVALGQPWIEMFDYHGQGLNVVAAAICPLVSIGIAVGVYRLVRGAARSG